MSKNKFVPAVFINTQVTPTISISMALSLLGLVIFLLLLTGNLSNHVKESLSFDIVLQDHTNEKQIASLQKELHNMSFAKSLDYVSKEQAIGQLAEELGQDPRKFLGFNPLPDLIVVHLNRQYVNSDSLVVIKNSLQKFSSSIKEMEYHEATLRTITEYIAKISFVFLVIALILLIISFALINNTIRMAVYSKRFFIRTMQLIGAKRWFICKPFILLNVFMGIIAASIACCGLYGLTQYIMKILPGMRELWDLTSQWIVYGSVLVLGILIAFVATYFAVNKYIGVDINKLCKV